MAMEKGVVERSSISGIILHVEDCGDQPAESLTFFKSESRTIAVGRKSSNPATEPDPERALFRCQVVSRKHAKITFTEYGNVYITDLHSHHGTHILRPGDFVSAPLTPEQPAVLADGDLITFGKSVGRDDCLVRPVVVRVELIFGEDAPIRLPPPSPRSAAADQGSPLPSELSRTRSTSGRYGVFLPSPEASSSSSDDDSDIQEISPPSSPHPVFTRISTNSFPPTTARMRLLQRILPPIHLAAEPEPGFSLQAIDQVSLEMIIGNVIAEEEDMDLSSSRSSSVARRKNDVVVVPEEPTIIGAWPGSPRRNPDSPIPSFVTPTPLKVPHEVIEISDDDASEGRMSEARENERETSEVEMVDVSVAEAEPIAEDQAMRLAPSADDEQLEVELDHNANASVTFDAITTQIAETLNDLIAMRDSRDQDEAAFSAHVEQTKSRLDTIDAQVHVTQASIAARDEDLSTMQTRLQGLDTVVSNLQERSLLAERLEELVKEVGGAKEMLQDICVLQEKTRAQMSEELEAVRALRAEAAAAVTEAKVVSAAIQTANTLKRKREDEVDEIPASHMAASQLSPSKRRRTLRVVSAVAHTATVATLGAVAAWGALAFS